MTEAALILIHAVGERSGFVGCGVLVEGGYVATCRHVWRDATAGGGAEAVFPYAMEGGKPARRGLALADACDAGTLPMPDLVLLTLAGLPSGVPSLQLAMHDRYEIGEAEAQAMVTRPREDGGDPWREVTIEGKLHDRIAADGRRQFSGQREQGYWFVRGSSGSPIFKRGGMQLAGILSLSELGVNERKNTLQEAFAVPATTIRSHVVRLVATPASQTEGIAPAQLTALLAELGAADTPVADIPRRLRDLIHEARARAADPLPPSNDGTDIAATLGTARDKLGRLDTAGALATLSGKLAEEEAARRQRMVPLLVEKAAIERLTYDHAAAKATLRQLLELAPDNVWPWIELGDLHVTTGDLTSALAAFRGALAAAGRAEPGGRDVAAAHDRIGNVQVAQGDLAAALASFRAALAIRERLVAADPANAEWQRDLSISHNKIGDVQVARGDLAAALASFRADLAIAERLAAADPAHTGWQRDLSVSHLKIGEVQVAQGDLAAALASFRAALAISGRLAAADPANALWQRDLSVSHERIGGVQMAQGDLPTALDSFRAALAIRERLASADPGNAEWQRDLSVSQNKIGDVQRAQGDLAAALRSYRDALAIGERLASADPGNAGWQRDLSVSHERIGDVQVAQGDLAAALRSYRDALAIGERLASADPGNAAWQRDMIVSCVTLAEVAPQEARAWLSRGLDTARDLSARGRLAPADAWMVADLERRLAALGD